MAEQIEFNPEDPRWKEFLDIGNELYDNYRYNADTDTHEVWIPKGEKLRTIKDRLKNAGANIIDDVSLGDTRRWLGHYIREGGRYGNEILSDPNQFDQTNPFVRLGKGASERVRGFGELISYPVDTLKEIGTGIKDVVVPSVLNYGSDLIHHPIDTLKGTGQNIVDYFTDPYNDPLVPLDIGLGAAGVVEAPSAIAGLTNKIKGLVPKKSVPVNPKLTSEVMEVPEIKFPAEGSMGGDTVNGGIPKLKTSDTPNIINKTTPEDIARFELSSYQRNLPTEKIPEVTEWQQGVHGTNTRGIENLDTSHFGQTDAGFYGHGVYNFDAGNTGGAYPYAFRPNAQSYIKEGYNLTPYQRQSLEHLLDKGFDYTGNVLEREIFNKALEEELNYLKNIESPHYEEMVDLTKNLNNRNDIVLGEYLFTDIPSNKYLFSFDDPVATQQILDPITNAINKQLPANATGSQFYEKLSDLLGSDKAASDYLNSVGVRGHYINDPLGRETVIYDGGNTRITGRKDVYNVDEYNRKKWGY